MLMFRGVIRSLIQTGFFAAVLLVPAGTWHWPRAIQLLVVLGLASLVSIIALARFAPASLEARVQSSASVLVLPLVFVPVVVRIFVEEKTLRESLPGYVEYMSDVPYRLVPSVW